MAIVVLKLPDVKRKREERPKQCPYCGGEIFQRWGQVNKPVKDVRVRNVKVYRYRCCQCQRTFRHYPEGNTPADQTERLRIFAIFLDVRQLSCQQPDLSGLHKRLPMTIWRDVQEEAQHQTQSLEACSHLGLMEYVLGWEKTAVLVLSTRNGSHRIGVSQ
jgi:hypothetical protein